MSHGRTRVLRAIVTDVVEGRLRPGDALVPANVLARRFGVAVEVAAAAMRHVESRGLATRSADDGLSVAPEAAWDVLDPDILDALLASGHGPAVLAEYLEYRRVVEVTAAGLAAEHATETQLAVLSDCLAAMIEAAGEGTPEAETRFHKADVAFHQALIAAAGNRPLELATDAMRSALCSARRLLACPDRRDECGLPEHQRILAAVAQGDPESAREAMAAHLDTVEAYLRELAGRPGWASQTRGGPDDR
jgi:GntR family transcriptional repressor for pyruvate dehydrogenase complex